MTELTQNLSLAQVRSLIDSYAFDLGCNSIDDILQGWSEIYNVNWIGLATIEALYLGRYKTVSIEQILNVWLRLGMPSTHFTYEFERLICRKLPKHLNNFSESKEQTQFNQPDRDIDFETFFLGEQQADLQQVEPVKPVIVTQQLTGTDVGAKEIAANDPQDLEKAFQSADSTANTFPLISALGLPCKSDWSEFAIGNKIIHQFIPLPDVSSFFNKLKTFGEERLEGQ